MTKRRSSPRNCSHTGSPTHIITPATGGETGATGFRPTPAATAQPNLPIGGGWAAVENTLKGIQNDSPTAFFKTIKGMIRHGYDE